MSKMSYRSGALAASLAPFLRSQLAEFGKVASVVGGADLALRWNNVSDSTAESPELLPKPTTWYGKVRAAFGKIVNSP